MGERINESDRGPRTADGSSTGFPASQGEQTVNEWGTNQRMETADRGPRTAVAQAFRFLRGEQTVNEWGTNQRMETADGRRQTAKWMMDGRP